MQTTAFTTTDPFATSERQHLDKEVFEEYGIYDDFLYKQNDKMQAMFVSKVYGILLVQIASTGILIALNMFVEPLRLFSTNYSFVPLLLLMFSMLVLVGLFFFSKKFPMNFILLTIWTFLNAQAVAMICALYEAHEVLSAVTITGIIVVALTVYVLITKVNLQWMGGLLMVGLFSLVLVSIVTIFFGLLFPVGIWWRFLLSGFGAFLFSLFILYDTSRLLHTCKYDDHIPAAIQLYLDILNLFLNILSLIGMKNRASA